MIINVLFIHRIKGKICLKDLLGPPNFDAYCTFVEGVEIETVKQCKEVLSEFQWSFRVHHRLCPLIHGWPYLLPDTFLPTKKLFLPLSSPHHFILPLTIYTLHLHIIFSISTGIYLEVRMCFSDFITLSHAQGKCPMHITG